MQQFLLPPVDVDPDDVCNEIVYALKKRTRAVPQQSSCCPWIHTILFWTLLLIRCDIVQSFFLDKNGNPLSLQRQLQSTPTTSPAKTYVARRINAGGESEYIDTNGVSWGADEWYGNKGRRTTPSECTSDILNTTDDILYCSNRFYPVSIVDPPYRYNIPVPYSALYEVRLHFAEAKFNSIKKRVFNILVEGVLSVENLDVYARAGALNAYVITLQTLVTDRIVTIQFIPVIDDPFISAIEVVEIPNITAPITFPTESPILVPNASSPDPTSTAIVRLNAGGEMFVDSKGNTWSNDTFFQGNSFVGDQACNRNISNTIDDALFCTERYFKGNSTQLSSYEIPVSGNAVYQLRLYFSENYFNKSGMRLFDVAVEGQVIIENFDILQSAGGPVTVYVVSVMANVTDGYFSVEFIPKVNYPTISAIEVLLVTDNVTAPLSVSPSASPTLDIAGQAVAECSAYPVCFNTGFTGNCCPLANGTSRECCSGKPQFSPSPSFAPSNMPSDILSSIPSIIPIADESFAPSVSVTYLETIKPSSTKFAPNAPQAPLFQFNKTIRTVSGVLMVLKQNTQTSEAALALNSNCTKMWQNAIQERIEAEVLAVIPMYETIDVNLFDVSRSSNISFISIRFDAVLEIRSAVQDVDANRFILGPFDSQSEKVNFIQYLTTTKCPEFENIAAMEIIIPSETKAEDKRDTSNNEDQLFLILFIAVGTGCGLILVAALIVTCVRMRKRRSIDEIDRASKAPGSIAIKEHRIESTPAEIDRSHDGTDISTLGDPILPETLVKLHEMDTSTVGSGGDEYDYKKAYLDLESVTESNMEESNTIVANRHLVSYSDDLHSVSDIVSATGTTESISDFHIPEMEYSIAAPPGLLGLILESGNVDGRPIVNSIKPFSALANRVRVGDHLVSVDNEDVSTMTASKVSQLIASKQHKVRILTFRSRTIDASLSNGVC